MTALRVYTSAPLPGAESPLADGGGRTSYLSAVRMVADWCETSGLRGLLLYSDNKSNDPWLLAQDIIRETSACVPIVAVQPEYSHPFAAARALATIVENTSRSVDINFVSGGFDRELRALGCHLQHDDRYDRLTEFGQIFLGVLRGDVGVFQGKYYSSALGGLAAAVSQDMLPICFVAGSSTAARRTAAQLDVAHLTYPLAIESGDTEPAPQAVRLGILARETAEEAWNVAEALFPPDPRGERLHRMAAKTAPSTWHRVLSDKVRDSEDTSRADVYWLRPFRTYRRFCPYLVGSYHQVATYLGEYQRRGVHTLIIDTPSSLLDLRHTIRALDKLTALGRDAVAVAPPDRHTP
jgi:alkanesulfonate monooxygenase